jgi:hypothetical protein
VLISIRLARFNRYRLLRTHLLPVNGKRPEKQTSKKPPDGAFLFMRGQEFFEREFAVAQIDDEVAVVHEFFPVLGDQNSIVIIDYLLKDFYQDR